MWLLVSWCAHLDYLGSISSLRGVHGEFEALSGMASEEPSPAQVGAMRLFDEVLRSARAQMEEYVATRIQELTAANETLPEKSPTGRGGAPLAPRSPSR
jgi:hypothetical protein